jgi:hypothetical protein
MNGGEVPNQSANRIHENEQRRDSCGLSNDCPFAEEKQWRQKNPATGSGQAGKKSKPSSDGNCDRL